MENQSAPSFEAIIERILSNWSALKQAVEHGMGSPEQARNFVQWLVEVHKMNEELDLMDLSDEICDYMDEQFHTQLDDNSQKEVAQLIVLFHGLLKKNDLIQIESEYKKLPPSLPWILSKRPIRFSTRTSNTAEEDSSSDEDESENDNEDAMEVEDGWEVVRRK